MPEPVLYESHLHTPLCKHATGNPGDYAAVAQRRGLKGIIVTCHNPIPNGYASGVRMDPEQYEEYRDLVQQAREEWAGKVDVRVGLECDYAPGMEPWLEDLLNRAPLHHVLGSIHPQMHDYRNRFFPGSTVGYQKLYFDHLAMAAESGFFDTLSHPDLIKNEAPHAWNPMAIIDDIRHSLDRIAKTGVAMELNTSGLNKALPEMNPGPIILKEMNERGIPVVLGADAHVPHRVADRFFDALGLLEKAGYTKVSIFLDRKRQEIPITAARASLLE